MLNIFKKNHDSKKNSEEKKAYKKQLQILKKAENTIIKTSAECNLTNTADNIIEIKNLQKNYLAGTIITPVLKNLSLDIKTGEFTVLYGKSGSGKSTLLNIMSGLDRAQKGSILVAGKNLRCLSDSKLTLFRRENVSFIFQSYNLLKSLSGYDNVLTGAYLQKDKSKLLDIDELFKEFEIEEIKHKFPSQMSGGQQQRISILRALIKNSKIIFADEPTGALDSNTAKIVLKMLKDINKKYNTTIVMVSHDADIASLAHKVIYLKNGLIDEVKIQTPKEL